VFLVVFGLFVETRLGGGSGSTKDLHDFLSLGLPAVPGILFWLVSMKAIAQ
jgi:hypothetical protein